MEEHRDEDGLVYRENLLLGDTIVSFSLTKSFDTEYSRLCIGTHWEISIRVPLDSGIIKLLNSCSYNEINFKTIGT